MWPGQRRIGLGGGGPSRSSTVDQPGGIGVRRSGVDGRGEKGGAGHVSRVKPITLFGEV
jgi:hypothetical protein